MKVMKGQMIYLLKNNITQIWMLKKLHHKNAAFKKGAVGIVNESTPPQDPKSLRLYGVWKLLS